jgi:hypothetical protein
LHLKLHDDTSAITIQKLHSWKNHLLSGQQILMLFRCKRIPTIVTLFW